MDAMREMIAVNKEQKWKNWVAGEMQNKWEYYFFCWKTAEMREKGEFSCSSSWSRDVILALATRSRADVVWQHLCCRAWTPETGWHERQEKRACEGRSVQMDYSKVQEEKPDFSHLNSSSSVRRRCKKLHFGFTSPLNIYALLMSGSQG